MHKWAFCQSILLKHFAKALRSLTSCRQMQEQRLLAQIFAPTITQAVFKVVRTRKMCTFYLCARYSQPKWRVVGEVNTFFNRLEQYRGPEKIYVKIIKLAYTLIGLELSINRSSKSSLNAMPLGCLEASFRNQDIRAHGYDWVNNLHQVECPQIVVCKRKLDRFILEVVFYTSYIGIVSRG